MWVRAGNGLQKMGMLCPNSAVEKNAGMAVCQESAKGLMDCLHQKNKMEGD